MRECDVCGERDAFVRLTVRPSRRCFDCVADDPALPADYRYKRHIEEPIVPW